MPVSGLGAQEQRRFAYRPSLPRCCFPLVLNREIHKSKYYATIFDPNDPNKRALARAPPAYSPLVARSMRVLLAFTWITLRLS